MDLMNLRPQIDRSLEERDPAQIATTLEQVRDQLDALRAAERGPVDKLNSREYMHRHFVQVLADAGITSGRVAEIGGPRNSWRDQLPSFDVEFLSIFADDDPAVHVADITHCPHIPDESFDVVFSISVMEHVARPWAAAREIRRILKPDGIVYHAAPFSYFFHGAPMDFWRYTPDAMRQLYPDFECLAADFYGQNRRRNNVGSAANPVDGDGGERFAVDAFGGWRENWFTLYAGRKTDTAAREYKRRLRQQLAVDTVAALMDERAATSDVFEAASRAMAHFGFDREGDVIVRSTPSQSLMPPEKIEFLWKRKRRLSLMPSPQRAVIAYHLERIARSNGHVGKDSPAASRG